VAAVDSIQKTAELNFAAPNFRASVEEKREQSVLLECDKRADAAKVRREDRIAFIQRCLELIDQKIE
jgi:hypothetical protein